MQNKKINIYTFMIMVYITCFLVSNICAFKLVRFGPLTLTAATLVFPITYILGDIFSEIYGFKRTKKIIINGFICNVIMIIVFVLAILMPYPDTFKYQSEFELVLGNTPRMLVASLTAYLIGGLSNSYTLDYVKYKTKINPLWCRLFISTIVGEFLDSLFFVTIGFIGRMSTNDIIIMILSQAILKILVEVLLMPIVSIFIKRIKKYEF